MLRTSELPRLTFVSSRMRSLSQAKNKATLFHKVKYKACDTRKAALNVSALKHVRTLDNQGGLVSVACPGVVKAKVTLSDRLQN